MDVALINASGNGEMHNLTKSGYTDGNAKWVLDGKADDLVQPTGPVTAAMAVGEPRQMSTSCSSTWRHTRSSVWMRRSWLSMRRSRS